jgi:hypothetical protein
MAKHAAPASRTVPTKAWAAISEDVPPQIYEVGWYQENLERQDLRHIRVMVTPIIRKRKRKKVKP